MARRCGQVAQQVGVSASLFERTLLDFELFRCFVNFRFHCGKGRKIPEDIHPQFHESVKHRMDYAPLNYKPRAIWKAGGRRQTTMY